MVYLYSVENVITLSKLLSLWFCFLLNSILFLKTQTSYRTYKIISSNDLARPVMGTIFLVIIIIISICNSTHRSAINPKNCMRQDVLL